MLKIIIKSIRRKVYFLIGYVLYIVYRQPKIRTLKETIYRIRKYRQSIARYGDGEFMLIWGISLDFQPYSESLSLRLREIVKNQFSYLDVALPDVFEKLNRYPSETRAFWIHFMGLFMTKIHQYIDINTVYSNSFISRFWSDFKSKDHVLPLIALYKEIWDGQNVVFIEGRQTRMGVGNDLFSNALSIRRILCPAEDAWSKYTDILDAVLKLSEEKSTILVIIALGPTATVLAHDLASVGFWALDLGHLDIQYEYYRRKAVTRTVIPGKYVNENSEGKNVSDEILDAKYHQSIIDVVN